MAHARPGFPGFRVIDKDRDWFDECCWPPTGDVGRAKGHRRTVRDKDLEEGHHHPGRRRGVHHGGETRVGPVQQAAVLGATPFVFPDHGEYQRASLVRTPTVRKPVVNNVRGSRVTERLKKKTGFLPNACIVVLCGFSPKLRPRDVRP